MDRFDGADIYSSRGLSREKKTWISAQLTAHHKLLLIAAAERARRRKRIRRANVEIPNRPECSLAQGPAIEKKTKLAKQGGTLLAKQGIVLERVAENQRLLEAIFGKNGESPLLAKPASGSAGNVFSMKKDGPLAQAGARIEKQANQLALSVAFHSGDSQDLAGMQAETQRLQTRKAPDGPTYPGMSGVRKPGSSRPARGSE